LKYTRERRGSGPKVRVNGQIRAKSVRTIDKDGEQVGIIDLDKALSLAKQSKLDLVEVAPQASPPVCRIMDYGKYHYLQIKKSRQAKKKQTSGKLKEIKIRPRIEAHDYEVKLRHAKEFLAKGYKLRVRLIYRGREMQHVELGNALLKRIEEDLRDIGHVETPPKQFGRNVVVLFGPAKSAKATQPQESRKDRENAKTEDKESSGQEV
jgi:translation initiation factor IF-3